jgi:hypothetical protein
VEDKSVAMQNGELNTCGILLWLSREDNCWQERLVH